MIKERGKVCGLVCLFLLAIASPKSSILGILYAVYRVPTVHIVTEGFLLSYFG